MAKTTDNNKKPGKDSKKPLFPNPFKKDDKKNDDKDLFPADAPSAPDAIAPVVAESSRESEPSVEAGIAPDAPSNEPEFVIPPVDEIPASDAKTGNVAPVAEAEPTAAVASTNWENVGPRTPHSDEQKLQKALMMRGNPKELTNADLSAAGINMSRIAMLDGRVGKFKLKRGHFLGNWTITVD